MSPAAVRRSMKKRGSCGLKQARYETSCRLLAARCLEVQNALVKVATSSASPAPVKTAVAPATVFGPRSNRKCRSASASVRLSRVSNDRAAADRVMGDYSNATLSAYVEARL